MGAAPAEDLDIFSTGWLRILPEPAFRALSTMLRLREHPVPGDLDELVARGLLDRDLDVPFQPHRRTELIDDDVLWARRWRTFKAYADRHGLPMCTPRDAIHYLHAIGLLERVDDAGGGGQVFWRCVAPVPLAEDLIELCDEDRRREARLRWLHAFEEAENAITSWILGRRTGAPVFTLQVSLAALAAELDLDEEEARHGLANALSDATDFTCTPHPELANAAEILTLVVDWPKFAMYRTMFVPVEGAAGEDDEPDDAEDAP
jgi:hypothetical protein